MFMPMGDVADEMVSHLEKKLEKEGGDGGAVVDMKVVFQVINLFWGKLLGFRLDFGVFSRASLWTPSPTAPSASAQTPSRTQTTSYSKYLSKQKQKPLNSHKKS